MLSPESEADVGVPVLKLSSVAGAGLGLEDSLGAAGPRVSGVPASVMGC